MANNPDEVPTPMQDVPAPEVDDIVVPDPPLPEIPEMSMPEVESEQKESSMASPSPSGLPPNAAVTIKMDGQGLKQVMQSPFQQAKPDLSDIPQAYHAAAKLFEQWAALPHDGFKLVVVRRRPVVWNGFRLAVGSQIEELDPMPIADLKEAIKELHGGGEYVVRGVTPAGAIAHQLPIRVDENQHAPKVPPNATRVSSAPISNAQFTQSTGAPSFGRIGFDSELHAANQKEQILLAEARQLKAEATLQKTKRELKRDEEADREREERRTMQPAMDIQRQIDSMREDMKDVIRAMQDNLKSVIDTVAHKKDDTLPLLIESMKASNESANRSAENQIKLLTAVLANNGNKGTSPELLEAIKMSGEAARSSAMAVADASKQEATTMRDLFMAMVTKNLGAPEDKVKTFVDAQNMGWDRAMQVMKMVSPQESDEVLDPEGGFWGNLGNLFLHGARRFVEGAATKAPSLLSALKPVPQFEAYTPPALPSPQPSPPVTAMAPLPAPVPPAPVQAASEDLADNPFVEGFVEDPQEPQEAPSVSEQSAPVPSPAPQETQQDPALDEDLRMHVTEAMRCALEDFNVGRKVHDWADYAADKWHRQFKLRLANAVDDAERIAMIGEKCESAVWTQLSQRLSTGRQDVVYFLNALHMLMSDTLTQAA